MIASLAERLASAKPFEREDECYRIAHYAGRLLAGNHLTDEPMVLSALLGACERNGYVGTRDAEYVESKLRAGLTAGRGAGPLKTLRGLPTAPQVEAKNMAEDGAEIESRAVEEAQASEDIIAGLIVAFPRDTLSEIHGLEVESVGDWRLRRLLETARRLCGEFGQPPEPSVLLASCHGGDDLATWAQSSALATTTASLLVVDRHIEIIKRGARARAEREIRSQIRDDIDRGAPTAAVLDLARSRLASLGDAEGNAPGFTFTTARALRDEPEDATPYFWPGVAGPGLLTGVGASAKTGKSWLLTAYFAALERGERWLGYEPLSEPVRTLVVTEQPKRVMREASVIFGLEAAVVQHRGGWPADASIARIAEVAGREAKRQGCRQIAFDTLQGLARFKENDAAEASTALAPMVALAGEGFAVIYTHHSPKKPGEEGRHLRASDFFRGSGALAADPDVLVGIPSADTPRSPQRRLLIEGRSDAPSLVVMLNRDGGYPWRYSLVAEAASKAGGSADERRAVLRGKILPLLPPVGAPLGLTRGAVEKECGGRATDVRAELNALVDEGKVLRTGTGTSAKDPFRFHRAPGPSAASGS